METAGAGGDADYGITYETPWGWRAGLVSEEPGCAVQLLAAAYHPVALGGGK